MNKHYTEIDRNTRKYTILERENTSFRATKIAEDLYEIKETIPCGIFLLEIIFWASKSLEIVSPVFNNYFEQADVVSDMEEYSDFKNKLFNRIKLDMEVKRVNNKEALECCKHLCLGKDSYED